MYQSQYFQGEWFYRAVVESENRTIIHIKNINQRRNKHSALPGVVL